MYIWTRFVGSETEAGENPCLAGEDEKGRGHDENDGGFECAGHAALRAGSRNIAPSSPDYY